jgi:predicted HicB family RNase H-like nuclease
MSAKLNIKPEVAERLAAEANERGVSVDAFLEALLDASQALPLKSLKRRSTL